VYSKTAIIDFERLLNFQTNLLSDMFSKNSEKGKLIIPELKSR
jgi:hypothetical protein